MSQARFLIDDNTVTYNSAAARAILVDAPDSSRTPNFYATVTNNTVTSTHVDAVTMISVAARNGATGHSAMSGNDVNFTGGSTATGINVREATAGTNELARGGSASNDSGVVLAANNPLSTTTVIPSAADIPVVENATILLPATPTLPSLPLLAAEGGVAAANGGGTLGGVLTDEIVALFAAEAVTRWAAIGLSVDQLATLNGVTITVADIGRNGLGLFQSGQIVIDDDGAGRGWFIDKTPFDDVEFTQVRGTQLETDPTGAPAGHYDLLTVVMHEMHHVLGWIDLPTERDADDVMAANPALGVRRILSKAR